ncbi:leucine-rich repeat receptor-like serine/threonine/tyrosine-protein kinase SOBIR1 [Tanacetum coccineum]
MREPDDTSSDYHNLVDQVNKDSEIGKRIRHWNVVPLIAYVSTPRCVYLIYEFLNNGSLDKMLRDVREGHYVLDWPLEYKIAVGVANVLEYLHHVVTPNVIHQDLKTHNILLDQDTEVGIADFGLATLTYTTLVQMIKNIKNSSHPVREIVPTLIGSRHENQVLCVLNLAMFLVRACLRDTQVAIKKIVLEEPDDTSVDYHNLVEQVKAKTKSRKRIRHQNVIPLLAYVSTPRFVYFIYEFMNNGSLDKILRDVREGSFVLDWPLKYKIAVGVANGLEYLHYGVTPNVIHRDLKFDNILLDQDMEAGIADFGLATSILDSKTSLQMPNNNGTLGYIDPKYFSTRVLRRCSDVFSFGIFLAEMVTLMSPSSLTDTTLVQLINNIKNSAHPVREIDPTLIGSRHENQVLRVLNLAIRCVYLSYDFSNIGSLEKMRRDVREGRFVLDWPLKYKIVVGVANGLEYLHYGVTTNFVNRDLKPDNILLDPNIEAGIADFGLATLILDSETSLKMPDNNGTLGYIDLEYFSTWVLRRCSDVFSFGIFLAEMVMLTFPSSLTDFTLVQLINNIKNSALACVYLIYEFLNNGSLEKILTDVREGRSALDWPLEYKIVVGVANGIEYLHHGVTPNVIHQDLKPNNILLDQDIEAGIADFGLAMPILDKDYKVKKSKNKPKTDKKRKRQDKSEEWKPISKPDQPDNKERKSKLNYQVPRINNVKFSKFKVSFG